MAEQGPLGFGITPRNTMSTVGDKPWPIRVRAPRPEIVFTLAQGLDGAQNCYKSAGKKPREIQ